MFLVYNPWCAVERTEWSGGKLTWLLSTFDALSSLIWGTHVVQSAVSQTSLQNCGSCCFLCAVHFGLETLLTRFGKAVDREGCYLLYIPLPGDHTRSSATPTHCCLSILLLFPPYDPYLYLRLLVARWMAGHLTWNGIFHLLGGWYGVAIPFEAWDTSLKRRLDSYYYVQIRLLYFLYGLRIKWSKMCSHTRTHVLAFFLIFGS
jgi:hypothetical protein